MNNVLLSLTALMFLIGGELSAADFEITKVIEVGPASWTPMSQPLQWSPDGTMLSYFSNRRLMISDTLGKTREIEQFDMYPHRYLWLSNDELYIHLDQGSHLDTSIQRLVSYNISTNKSDIIEEYNRYKYYHDRSGTREFDGPYRTIEGHVYYERRTYSSNSVKKGFVVEQIGAGSTELTRGESKHVLRWGENGLYKINIDSNDSMRIGPKPQHTMRRKPIINHDGTHVMTQGTIIRLIDSSIIVMDTISFTRPQDALFCSFLFTYFNPKYSEILFHLTCDSKETQKVLCNKIGVFNYITSDFTIYNQPLNSENYTTPAYSPDGCKIAYIADNVAYIMYRKYLGE